MKRIPVWMIVVWIVIGVLGGVAPLVLWLAHGPMLAGWLILAALLAVDGVWILLRLLAAPKKKIKAAVRYAGDGVTYERILRETEEAVDRYLRTAVGKSHSRKSLLYERPWFLLCGAKKAGKTSLLRGSGLHFPVTYPSERDGLQLAGSERITWYFANEAVWIDVPGSLMEETGRDEWQALMAALAKVRPDRPIDGIACVVSGAEVLEAEDTAVRDVARMLRSRIDELIGVWGIEFPVYLIFNQADRIPGFTEFFAGKPQLAQKHILGATLTLDKQKMMPRVAFADEFSLLRSSLENVRLDMLHDEPDGARKRQMCRFVIHFEGMQEKLGAYVAEMFRSSSYVGKPLFRGFYFTSCRPAAPAPQAAATPSAPVGNTIINHTLNPKRAAIKPAAEARPAEATPVASSFVLPIFRSIMVRDRVLVKTTVKRSQRERIQFILATAMIAAVMLVVGAVVLAARSSSGRLLTDLTGELSRIAARPAQSLVDQYHQLDGLRQLEEKVRRAERRSGISLGFYQGKPVREELTRAFQSRAQRLIVAPTAGYLEYQIQGGVQEFGELSGEQYQKLYAALKAYLSMSEAVVSHRKDIDTTFLRASVTEAVTQALLATFEQARLPEQLEVEMSTSIGLYLRLLAEGSFAPIQENQSMVANARSRLQRLPDARNLYQTVINRLLTDAPTINLDKILNRTAEGILKSGQDISALYTQQGFEETVSDALSAAAKNPLNIDWVIGLTRDQIPEGMLDAGALREEMVAAYCEDAQARWVQFIASITMDPFGDLARSARILQMLASPRSELEVLLEAFGQTLYFNPESRAEKMGGALLGAAAKNKQTKGLAKQADKAEKAASALPFGGQTPFDRVNRFFDPLRSFTRSTGGGMGGFQGYRDKMLTLAEALAQAQTQGEQSLPSVLTGKPDDPLQSAWRFTQTECAGMDQQLADALRGILVMPLQHAGAAASDVLARVLNDRWHAEVIKGYTSRFSGRYPFASRGEDASFTDAMEFFRPSTGTYWGFYDRVLSPYIVKTPDGWMVRSLGSISLQFNPQLAKSLAAAERIREIFFKPDGTVRSLMVTISPVASNTKSATLTVNGQSNELSAKTKQVQVAWPSDAKPQGASLKVQVSADFAQDKSFPGPWGLLKLMGSARVAKMSESAFSAKWEVNVQNMYVVQQSYRVQVGSADHPFVDRVFEQFECPTDIVKVEQKAAPAP